MNRNPLWIGYHAQHGYICFDLEKQDDRQSHKVCLWVHKTGRFATFDKARIRRECVKVVDLVQRQRIVDDYSIAETHRNVQSGQSRNEPRKRQPYSGEDTSRGTLGYNPNHRQHDYKEFLEQRDQELDDFRESQARNEDEGWFYEDEEGVL